MEFPIGITADVLAVAAGGLIGAAVGKYLQKRITDSLFIVTAFCAFGIGIISTIKLSDLTVVMLSVILGCIIGELCRIEDGIESLISRIAKRIGSGITADSDGNTATHAELLCLAMAIICFSGTGFFGALSEGLDSDHSILLAKSALDFFTVLVIAAQIGSFVSLFSIPQAIIFVVCFFLARFISPILTPDAIANFKSVGGILTLVIGYNMLASQVGLKQVRVLNLTPAFILVLVFAWAATFSIWL